METERFYAVAVEYENRFKRILDRIWPTIKSNGFNEHNQTTNFIAAYDKIAHENCETISIWYEFQIPNGNKRNNRIDGLIINHTTKSIYLIEAKRFSQNTVDKKRQELGEDICRIMDLDIKSRFEGVFYEKETILDYSVYGVFLFDLWTYSNNHESEKLSLELWLQFCKRHNMDSLSDFFYLDATTTDRIKKVKESILSTIQEGKKYNDCIYHLGVFVIKTNDCSFQIDAV